MQQNYNFTYSILIFCKATKACGLTDDQKTGNDNADEKKDRNGNKKESCYLNKSYCHANHNNLSGDCKFCPRNLSRCYSEGDASVILNASSLLAASQIDSNNLEKITPLRQTFGDISCNNNDEVLQKDKPPQSSISG